MASPLPENQSILPASFETCIEDNSFVDKSTDNIEAEKQRLIASKGMKESIVVHQSSENLDNKKLKARKTNKKGKLKCLKCEKTFRLKSRLTSHMKSMHKDFGYRIKSIIDKRCYKGQTQYKCTWANCKLYEATWEPAENLVIDVPEFIASFESAQKESDEPGERHCICRGLDNGAHMIQCTTCQNWFHSTCVEIDPTNIPKEEMLPRKWRCNECRN